MEENKMNYKYIILDFGKVIAAPTNENWDITPKLLELIDINKIDINKFKELKKEYRSILSEKITTLEEEYNMFIRFYEPILKKFGYSKDIAEEIAYDRTYNFDKYTLYDNIQAELKSLSERYRLILLTDNWPCVINYLKEYNLYDYFDKIYISSLYGVEKKDKKLFDYPINELNIKKGEALFIDDNKSNLDIAKEKGLDVMLMDRENIIKDSKYKIINNLNIIKKSI